MQDIQYFKLDFKPWSVLDLDPHVLLCIFGPGSRQPLIMRIRIEATSHDADPDLHLRLSESSPLKLLLEMLESMLTRKIRVESKFQVKVCCKDISPGGGGLIQFGHSDTVFNVMVGMTVSGI